MRTSVRLCLARGRRRKMDEQKVHRCPSMEAHSGGAAGVYEVECSQCGEAIEFFAEDKQRKCPSCKSWCVNPRLETE